MKIDPHNNLHLTYCTNIHPGESWPQVRTNLEQYIPLLKARLSPDAPFGIGLRLSDEAARELLTEDHLIQFQSWLIERNLYVFTLNGFPYGGFHGTAVKDRVYAPDWSDRLRFDYTLRLLNILAVLLPEGIEGSISTLPLSYKPWWSDRAGCEAVYRDSSLHLAQLTAEMDKIRQETGKLIHLGLEPEPDGLLENGAEVVQFYQKWLLPIGRDYLAQQGIPPSLAADRLLEHIRICYDTCHFAVEYEDPAAVVQQFQVAGIKISKIQLSAALKVNLSNGDRHDLHARLLPFAESTYLHQVIERWADGTLHHYRDLAVALPFFKQSAAAEWRTHFHVPIFIENYQLLQSTQDHIVSVLQLLPAFSCSHLEIETYTWDVLPPQMKQDLLTSIEREYRWVQEEFRCRSPHPLPLSKAGEGSSTDHLSYIEPKCEKLLS
jgi:hypothetical protein